MGIFRRDLVEVEARHKRKEEIEEGIKRLKAEKLPFKDILAIILAMYKVILPFALGILVVYGLFLLFLTEVWLG